jgi:hypothetical protein
VFGYTRSKGLALTTRQRQERVAKMATMTHKDRVQEFNAKLDLLRCVFVSLGTLVEDADAIQ